VTEEEHIARAMLLGMCYHHGNGDPFYFKLGADGIPEVMSMLDANTLEPLAEHMPDNGLTRVFHGKGMAAHKALFGDFGSGNKLRNHQRTPKWLKK
jgi:hypothetical protein